MGMREREANFALIFEEGKKSFSTQHRVKERERKGKSLKTPFRGFLLLLLPSSEREKSREIY
jgi:hypothetical protein